MPLAEIEPSTFCLEVPEIAINLSVWLFHRTPDIAYALPVDNTLYLYLLRCEF